MKLTLLGQEVEGQPDIQDPNRRTHWMITRGPYEAHITEWNFEHTGYDSPPYTNYSYHLKIGSEYILHSQSSVMTAEEAVSIIHNTLAKYIKDKRMVEAFILGV